MSSPKKSKRFLVLPVFVTAQELVSHLEQPTSAVIFDVRSDQEVISNGKIINSVNIEASNLLSNIPLIYEKYKNIDRVYFHCALSQVRGPKCAQEWANYINEREHRTNQQVYILKGGFDHFKGVYGLDKTITEGVKFGY